MWIDIALILLPAGLVFAFLLLRKVRTRSATALPSNPILVDGSNVLHWGGEPSSRVLRRVLQALVEKDYDPIVFFDANIGYLLGDRYFDETMMARITGIPEEQICVVSKGVVADESILMFATDHDLRVVTNDRYRDWRDRFPLAARKGALVGGRWQEGSVVWRGTL